jgi:hypothetical protein
MSGSTPGSARASSVLPAPGARHQQVVAARRSDLQGTLDVLLPADVAEIGQPPGWLALLHDYLRAVVRQQGPIAARVGQQVL